MSFIVRVPCCLVLLAFTAGWAWPGERPQGKEAKPAAAVPLPAKEKFHLFLLVGQSNMLGMAKAEDQDRVAPPRVYAFNDRKEWIPAADPLQIRQHPSAGVCLGRTFGIEVAATDPTIAVGLIPAAVGSTNTGEWLSEKCGYYDKALKMAQAASEKGTLKGILWHQGESDCLGGQFKGYRERLQTLAEKFRTDLKQPDLPFIVGELGPFLEKSARPGVEQVNAALKSFPSHVARSAFVSAEGLKDKGDKTHFDAASTRELGHRYAAAYLQLVKTGSESGTSQKSGK